ACGGGAKTPASGDTTAAAPAAAAPAAAAAAGPQTPDPGRKVIIVQLIADEKGSRFEPNEIEAHRGDVIRFTLSQGVHNVDFLPDSNPGAKGLPAPSDMLQLAGQTFDVKVTFPNGKYYFQCDPHVALGMHGHLEVEE
ncbi:MAG TPA: plastocyanin/azurin family copper-binding protein, partial [Rudaea sp.]|nr:plastocyanin/azurin family copper-binding protein [Rudaea sp.]